MSDDQRRSGKFLLRMEPALHQRLTDAAMAEGVSLNEHCVRALARESAANASPFSEAVSRVLRQLGNEIIGIAIFGSVARGQARSSSDVDMLVVCDDTTQITRSLYTSWDAAPLHIDGRLVEPHFVRMPDTADRVSGLWAEVAMEGAVVYDPTLELARRLAHIRRRIFSGELMRRTAQGHAYWTAA